MIKLALSDLQKEAARLQRWEIELRAERKRQREHEHAINDRLHVFEERMRAFRWVCTVAWDVVTGTTPVSSLKEALEETDRLWEGFAGCIRDPEDTGAVSRSAIGKQVSAVASRVEKRRRAEILN